LTEHILNLYRISPLSTPKELLVYALDISCLTYATLGAGTSLVCGNPFASGIKLSLIRRK